jgi:hypothetical protein
MERRYHLALIHGCSALPFADTASLPCSALGTTKARALEDARARSQVASSWGPARPKRSKKQASLKMIKIEGEIILKCLYELLPFLL